ncbi:MAG: glycosyltransferase family 2 protein [Planctomycetota bacterium]
MPCLNEADTLGICIRKARAALDENHIIGEIIIADNGSTDGSREIATRAGARVVPVEARGYGNALMAGIAAARGRFVIMGDADDSYDFGETPRFVEVLRKGKDLVMGCRFPSGGGRVMPGAMPFLHYWVGNPLFSMLMRVWFYAPIHDAYCGLRGFTKALYECLDMRCTGMEFATEMIIKASRLRVRIGEVPITLHPDGRKAHAPHLKTFRDGWRTLRMFLLYCPRWLFLGPGEILILFGLIGYAVAMPATRVGRMTFDAHTLLFSSLAIVIGFQAVFFALFTKTFGITEGILPPDGRMDRFFRLFTLERGLVAGGIAFLAGAGLLLGAVIQWRHAGFGRLDYPQTMRWVIPGVTLVSLGMQTILGSFFLCVLGLRRK